MQADSTIFNTRHYKLAKWGINFTPELFARNAFYLFLFVVPTGQVLKYVR